jgi:hypothetical protein
LAAVLVSACGKNEIADDFKGYTLPVTVNVTRQGDEPATRATYNESTRKLSFSTGDKLFVMGDHAGAGTFAGTLDYDAGSGKFSGTVTTQEKYTGTIDDLMASAYYAFLLPAGYGSYGFLSIVGSGYGASVSFDLTKAFALTKAAAVEQFSVEYTDSYSSGFALAPNNAIVSFTISGLTANKKVDVSFNASGTVISGKVTTNATGVATFAIGVSPGNKLENCTLTVDGNNIAMPTKQVEPGHIYNISRSVAPENITWNSSVISGINIINAGSFVSDGITVALSGGENGSSFDYSDMYIYDVNDFFTFTSSVGNIKKIEINYTGEVEHWYEPSDGWSLGDGTLTWEGDDPAKSVTLSSSEKLLSESGYSSIEGITSIVFTLE